MVVVVVAVVAVVGDVESVHNNNVTIHLVTMIYVRYCIEMHGVGVS